MGDWKVSVENLEDMDELIAKGVPPSKIMLPSEEKLFLETSDYVLLATYKMPKPRVRVYNLTT